jgi:hypothetical protein
VYEKIDPLQGGFLRRKHRMDRRPTMSKEGRLGFWARYGSDVAYKHWKMAQLYWRFRGFIRELERDGAAKGYTDVALTPDADTDTNALEMMLTHIAVGR